MNVDEIYTELVKKDGLFGQAFFGHKKTRKQARRLRYLWAKAQKMASEKSNFLAGLSS